MGQETGLLLVQADWTGANMALRLSFFAGMRRSFMRDFLCWKIESIEYHDFLRYMLSGGLSLPAIFSRSVCIGTVDVTEVIFKPFMSLVGQEMLVTVRKI